MTTGHSPLLDHRLEAPSVFTPGDLMDAVRRERQLGAVTLSRSWACFHTQMLTLTIDGLECGVVPRTIGGTLCGADCRTTSRRRAASLFAFGAATGAAIGMVALVSNSPTTPDEQFDTGGHDYRWQVLGAVGRAAERLLEEMK